MVFALSACTGSGSASSTPPASTPSPSDSGSSGAVANEWGVTSTTDITLKLGHVSQTSAPYHQGCAHLAELIAERTDGHFKIEVYPASQLGNEVDMIEGLQMGTVDMLLTSTAPVINFIPDLGVLDMPYLFSSKEQARAAVDSDIAMGLLDSLNDIGIRPLCFFESGFMFLHTTVPVAKPEDAVGLKIRTMENTMHMGFVNSIGAAAIPMAFSEVYTALDNGTMQGGVNNISFILSSNFHKVSPYMDRTDHVYVCSPLLVGTQAWDKLPEDYRDLLVATAKEAAQWQRAYVDQYEEDGYKQMTEEGAIWIDVDVEAFKACAQTVIDQYVPSVYPQELYDSLHNFSDY